MLLFSLFFVFDGLTDLFADLFVAIVNNLYQELSTFIDGCSMKHNDFQNVQNDGLVIKCKIDFERVHFGDIFFDESENFLLPSRSHDEVVNKDFKFVIDDEFF